MVVVDIAPVSYEDNNIHIINSLYNLSNLVIKDRKTADSYLSDWRVELSVRAFLLKNLSRVSADTFGLKLNIKRNKTAL